MAIPVIKIQDDREALFSPYSGLVLYGEHAENMIDLFDKAEAGDGEIEEDPTILFCYVSDVCMYSYVHPKLRELFDFESDDIDPAELCNKLNVDSSLAFQHDAGWSGETWWGFGKI
ncbi:MULTISPECIES: hypothetical protein [Vibrio]|uniref:Uncharacterized protein n=1 Tax=Vibrio ezurae NBRC 102218 TaxID=1219080 RepID=U3B1A3_9VIBR|nr:MULTISPECIES: hypothetical protein [Vibrio]GAD79740.1 hypothetical protein VEZ01S_20_00120 [Vibrio ezurae NBRC 102218]